MPREFKLPDLGEGLPDAEIVQVLVAEGEVVREDQPVLLVETEKAQVELPSPFGGRVARIHVRAGQRAKVGTVLLSFDEEGAKAARASAPPPREAARGRPAAPAAPAPPGAPAGAPPAATPATRRLARELGVDLTTVRGSGPAGRIVDDDVRAAGGRRPEARPRAGVAAPRPAAATPATVPPAEPAEARPLATPAGTPPLPRFEQWGPVEREALRGVRRRSAEHLALAWSLVPHVTQHDEADITDLEAMRRRLAADWGDALTLTVFLVKAVSLALAAHPRFNASLDPERGELVKKRYYHIGVATDTEHGLIVPVVRDADQKRLRELAEAMQELVGRTRAGKATIEDLRGGTFTVTNTGALGGTGATPIINYPEVAILGVGRARLRPVVRPEGIVPRLLLPLSLAFDHRVLDGMEAARFSTDLVRLLEAPERLLLDG
jgi:pyruvate dehydrogenase E2 component (dihydrolipoamide acetyltransferase)